jgi:hypothetical protein
MFAESLHALLAWVKVNLSVIPCNTKLACRTNDKIAQILCHATINAMAMKQLMTNASNAVRADD